MNKIIKSFILLLIILLPAFALAKKMESSGQGAVYIINQAESLMSNPNRKLSLKIVKVKTKKEEEIEKHNQQRLDLYKERLNQSRNIEGRKNILITGYSSTPDQCWGNPFVTASGTHVHDGTMACPPQYPFGTKIKIEGVGTFICEDRGGAIKGNHFDMWFPSRQQALNWGKRYLLATISK